MCTTIAFKHKEGMVFGRTLEIGIPMDHDMMYLPKDSPDFIQASDHKIDGKYAVLGTSFKGYESFGDGINEEGLMASYNFFPSYGTFSTSTQADCLNLILSEAFNYLLSHCKDVKEVLDASKDLNIVQTYPDMPEYQSTSNHFFFKDKKGDGLVLEPFMGKLIPHQNPYDVLTNSPQFDWHVTNLRNYLHLIPTNRVCADVNGREITMLGQGTGMLGMPGDFSPTSRFVRAAYFVSNTPKDLNKDQAILQAFRILSQFDIPKGSIFDPVHDHKDETLYTSVMESSALSYSIKCQNNIDLQNFYLNDYKDEKEIVRIPLSKNMLF